MTSIKIIKKNDTYAYKYDMIDENNKAYYVTKSGFKTPEEALEAAKKSYHKRTSNIPLHVEKVKPVEKKPKKPNLVTKIKNLYVSNDGYKLVTLLVSGAVVITFVCGIGRIIKVLGEKFAPQENPEVTLDEEEYKPLITSSDCEFSNLHVIVRTANEGTIGVGAVTSDMLTRLGVSNELVSKDSDISKKIDNAINDNKDSKILVINIETGYENKNNNNSIVMGDSSNRRTYPSDILAACINTSLNEYDLNSVLRSGVKTGIWRNDTYLEDELSNSNLINNVSQLTIDLPIGVSEDNITRNDAAAAIVEGIMRWTTLDPADRYRDIYYTTVYGDTLTSICSDHGISIQYMVENSDINMQKGVRVGNTVLVGVLPKTATNEVRVYNPYVTIDSNKIETNVITYVVQSGDTVTKIANMYGVKIEDIVVPSGNINNIQIGDELYITTFNLYETHGKKATTEKHI